MIGGERIVGSVEASLGELKEKMGKQGDDLNNPVSFPLKLNEAASGGNGRMLG